MTTGISLPPAGADILLEPVHGHVREEERRGDHRAGERRRATGVHQEDHSGTEENPQDRDEESGEGSPDIQSRFVNQITDNEQENNNNAVHTDTTLVISTEHKKKLPPISVLR